MYKEKTFLSYNNRAHFLNFYLRFLIFAFCSVLSIINGFFIAKLIIILLTFFINHLWYRNNMNKTYFFILISSIMVCIFWTLFGKGFNFHLNEISFLNTIKSYAFQNAVIKVCSLFLVGQTFLITTSQKDILNALVKLKVNINIIIFVVVSINSVVYFLCSIKTISSAYRSRTGNYSWSFKQLYYTLPTMLIDGLFLMLECKKVYLLYELRIKKVLEGDNCA